LDTFVQGHVAAIRLGFFFGIFAVMALWEMLAPRRTLTVSKIVRWVNNLTLVVLSTVLLRLLFPAAAFPRLIGKLRERSMPEVEELKRRVDA
jgi:hypothetical protein